ncbi:hypothetical protein ACH5RR_029766 [Cinchona calisaya]|uniref:Uncharacterized protein n=1 Tax=Cinchona calisaya TaxID=153742 RepID=A0ABD2YSK7_9GENT
MQQTFRELLERVLNYIQDKDFNRTKRGLYDYAKKGKEKVDSEAAPLISTKLKIGAASETEVSEKKDRFTDALNAKLQLLRGHCQLAEDWEEEGILKLLPCWSTDQWYVNLSSKGSSTLDAMNLSMG